jgi:energy-coupling factor transport system substrate-specific component
MGTAATSWQPGIGLREIVARYSAFYITTSLLWDVGRAVGNMVLILVLGVPAVRALSRFHNRLHFRYEP